MRAASKIIFLGLVFIALIFTCSTLPCFTDTYASFSDTKHTSDDIILDVWDNPANLIGLSYLNMTKSTGKLNGTTIDAIGDQSSVFTYKSFLAENPSDNVSYFVSNVNSSVSNVNSSVSNVNSSVSNVNPSVSSVNSSESSVNPSVSSVNPSVSNISSADNITNNSLKTESETIILNKTVTLTEASENNMDSNTSPSSGGTTATSGKHKEPLPIANFSSNITEGYAPLSIQFTDHSEKAIGWRWDFGDGDTSTDEDPVHTFSEAGEYTVDLTVNNENGTNSKVAIITVHEQPAGVLPIANFSSNVTEGYAPLTVQFADISKNATGINWEFGDGDTSTDENPIHTYFVTGNYAVNLEATNENGTNSKVAKINVLQPIMPVANFSSNVTEGYAPLTTQFTDLSENVTQWRWDFGDGNISSEQDPVHIYYKAGTYSVNLIAINENGTNSKVAIITVHEQTDGVLPIANFSSNVTEGYAPLTVQFTDISKNATGINWEFGDGDASSEQNPIHTYSVTGNYTVNLEATNENGTNSKVAKINVLQPIMPVANFSSNVTYGYSPLNVQFTDFSENVTQWRWDFGDGNISSEQDPVHIYSKAGTYSVNLIAINENGTNSKLGKITVLQPILPVANFRSNITEGYAPLTVQFIDLSGNVTQWRWDFGDGNISSEQDPVHIYSKAGTYSVNLTAINENGTNSKVAKINVLQPIMPVANFSSNVTYGYSPLNVQFTDFSENVTQWSWDFGDGDTSSKQNPVHVYSTAGTYSVDLIAINENGTNSKLGKITVLQPILPVANFSSNITEGYAPLTVQFIDLSENSTGINWEFGDGNTSSEQNPVHIYSEAGIFNVNLTATNENNTNIKTSKITVDENVIVPLV